MVQPLLLREVGAGLSQAVSPLPYDVGSGVIMTEQTPCHGAARSGQLASAWARVQMKR